MKKPREILAESPYIEPYHGYPLKVADDLIGALTVAGYVIVPKEPTKAIWEAAYREWDDLKVWKVMIEAALKEQGG